jgi:hypothetical protein
MLSTNGICTLVDVVIVNPIQTNFFSHVISSCELAPMVVAQTKEGRYHD